MKTICFTFCTIAGCGGTERVGINLANAFSRQGYKVYILSYINQGGTFFKVNPEIEIHYLLRNPLEKKLKHVPAYVHWRYRQLMKRWQTDVVIDVDTDMSVISGPALEKTGISLISWNHFYFEYSTDGERGKQVVESIARYAKKLVVLTNADLNKYKERTPIREEQLVRICNPLTFEVDHPIDHVNQKKVLAMGRLGWEKGFDLMIKAWSLAESRVPGWNLEIVCGNGDYHALQTDAEALGCTRITCTGPITKVKEKMEETALYVLPSRFEGFGLVIIEAATCSVPTVSFNCPSGPGEILTDGVDGYLAEPENPEDLAEKIVQIILDDEKRAEMGKMAYLNSKRFTMDRILAQWKDIIDNL